MAIDGTTIINFLKPYSLYNSRIVRRYTYVLPVPVSISIVKLFPSSSVLSANKLFANCTLLRFFNKRVPTTISLFLTGSPSPNFRVRLGL